MLRKCLVGFFFKYMKAKFSETTWGNTQKSAGAEHDLSRSTRVMLGDDQAENWRAGIFQPPCEPSKLNYVFVVSNKTIGVKCASEKNFGQWILSWRKRSLSPTTAILANLDPKSELNARQGSIDFVCCCWFFVFFQCKLGRTKGTEGKILPLLALYSCFSFGEGSWRSYANVFPRAKPQNCHGQN